MPGVVVGEDAGEGEEEKEGSDNEATQDFGTLNIDLSAPTLVAEPIAGPSETAQGEDAG